MKSVSQNDTIDKSSRKNYTIRNTAKLDCKNPLYVSAIFTDSTCYIHIVIRISVFVNT